MTGKTPRRTRKPELAENASKKPERSAQTDPLKSGQDLLALPSVQEALVRRLQTAEPGGAPQQVSVPAVMRAADVQSLQQRYGNRAVSQVLQRENGEEAETGEESEAEEATAEDLADFREHGPYPASAEGETILPRTGMGGFNARYDPDSMVLTITVNIGFNFVNGMEISGDTVTATESSMDSSAEALNERLATLSGEQKTVFLNLIREQWQWTGAEDPRITTWMAGYKSNVQGAWSSAGTGIVFEGSREGWEDQLARVNVVANTTNITSLAAGAPIPGPQPVHCQATIYKTPDQDVFGAYVEGGTAGSATDQRLFLGSGQITEEGQSHLLQQQVFFDNNSSVLNGDAVNTLDRMIVSFQAPEGGTGTTIDITGRASTTGEQTETGRRRNIELSRQRAEAVEDYLKNTEVEGRHLENVDWRVHNVVSTGAEGATEDESWRRADVAFAGGEGQNIAAHEFGHMIGLMDEYASTPARDEAGNIITDAEGNPVTRGLISGTGGDVGEETEHSQLGEEMGLGGSVYENNENMMSLGSTVQPQHYATFMQALHEVTEVTDWRLHD